MASTREVSEPLATTEDCRYCWMCRHVCPVGHVTQRETHTPHAWALTIASVRRGALAWNDEVTDVLYACADCGMCRTHCITNRPLPDAIAVARAQVVASGHAPRAVRDLQAKLEQWGNPYGARDAAAAAVAGAAEAAGSGAVALFVGDAAAFLTPAALAAARALLTAAGVTPVLVGVGRSNGILADSLGLAAQAQALARAVIADVQASACRELLVLSAADRYAFERVYPERLKLALPEGVVVKEVTAVLAEAVTQGRLAFTPRADAPAYAYQDPPHAPRIGRDGTAPSALLHAALGEANARRLFWRDGRAHPAGAVGGLEFTQPDIAAKLTAARFADAASAGASWLIAEDAGSLHHLRQHQAGAGVEVVGLYELLAEQLQR